jgi:hypothetical protein
MRREPKERRILGPLHKMRRWEIFLRLDEVAALEVAVYEAEAEAAELEMELRSAEAYARFLVHKLKQQKQQPAAPAGVSA